MALQLIRGIGVDIVNISGMKEILERSGDLFIKRVFTDAEQKAAMERNDPVAYYAANFAAKEAIFKTFGTDWECGAGFLDIEVLRGSHGEPLAGLKGRFAEISGEEPGGRVLVSLSYDGDIVISVAALV